MVATNRSRARALAKVAPASLAALVLIAMSACGSATGDIDSASTRPSNASAVQTKPWSLVGTWTVEDTDAATTAGTSVTMDGGPGPDTDSIPGTPGGQYTVRIACGEVGGDWHANTDGMFVASPSWTGSEKCASRSGIEGPAWLNSAVGYRTEGAEQVLVGRDGSVVARLVPRTGTAPGTYLDLRDVDPVLPAGVRPATANDLVGIWISVEADPATQTEHGSYFGVNANGTWGGTDGCNGTGGRWVIGPAGAVLATSGPSTLVGCAPGPGGDVSRSFPSASRAGFVGGRLVFYGDHGQKIAVLQRAAEPMPTLTVTAPPSAH